jgi:hypothetical protein
LCHIRRLVAPNLPVFLPQIVAMTFHVESRANLAFNPSSRFSLTEPAVRETLPTT